MIRPKCATTTTEPAKTRISTVAVPKGTSKANATVRTTTTARLVASAGEAIVTTLRSGNIANATKFKQTLRRNQPKAKCKDRVMSMYKAVAVDLVAIVTKNAIRRTISRQRERLSHMNRGRLSAKTKSQI